MSDDSGTEAVSHSPTVSVPCGRRDVEESSPMSDESGTEAVSHSPTVAVPGGRRDAEVSTGDCNSGVQSMLRMAVADDAMLSLPPPMSDDSPTKPVSQPATASVLSRTTPTDKSIGDCNPGLQSMLLMAVANDAVLSMSPPVCDDSPTKPVSQLASGCVLSRTTPTDKSTGDCNSGLQSMLFMVVANDAVLSMSPPVCDDSPTKPVSQLASGCVLSRTTPTDKSTGDCNSGLQSMLFMVVANDAVLSMSPPVCDDSPTKPVSQLASGCVLSRTTPTDKSTGDCNSGLQSMLLRSLANDAVLSLPPPVLDASATKPV